MKKSSIEEIRDKVVDLLLDEKGPSGIWKGRLSSSALATATAIGALHLIDSEQHSGMIARGLAWVAEQQNSDGGWGDAPGCESNSAATLLCWSTLACLDQGAHVTAAIKAREWIDCEFGASEPGAVVRSLEQEYGSDRTFSVPILAFAAIAGRLDEDGWKYVRQLPFEIGLLPHRFLKWMRLPVVSYALPALLSIGVAKHHHSPSRWPHMRILRGLLKGKAMKKLQEIQPVSGGFLEAIPLTAFTSICLASIGASHHPVVKKAERFLVASQRADGSWPIDLDLATWLTSSATTALGEHLGDHDKDVIRTYLLDTQHSEVHPFTHAEPGGWAWTDLSGGVPDCDDSAAALLALNMLGPGNDLKRWNCAISRGVDWLMSVQNSDGGWPTFCRGWGKLPFDRSCPDITAHAVAAISSLSDIDKLGIRKSISRAMSYLSDVQSSDGSFLPLWFGNQDVHDKGNPVYGSAVVARHLLSVCDRIPEVRSVTDPALAYLIDARGDGGWGGSAGVRPSVEETSIAVDALAMAMSLDGVPSGLRAAVESGTASLVDMIENGSELQPSPIGLYFAKLWYYERLYPLIFSLRALGSICTKCE